MIDRLLVYAPQVVCEPAQQQRLKELREGVKAEAKQTICHDVFFFFSFSLHILLLTYFFHTFLAYFILKHNLIVLICLMIFEVLFFENTVLYCDFNKKTTNMTNMTQKHSQTSPLLVVQKTWVSQVSWGLNTTPPPTARAHCLGRALRRLRAHGAAALLSGLRPGGGWFLGLFVELPYVNIIVAVNLTVNTCQHS